MHKETYYKIEVSFAGAHEWAKYGSESFNTLDNAKRNADWLIETQREKAFDYRVIKCTYTEEPCD